MCHRSVHDFFHAELTPSEIAGRRILEVGSRDVNGTVRPLLTALGARDYVGVDVEPGPGVDRLCDVASLATEFAADSFEVVVSTEMLEHVRDWKVAIDNLKRVVGPGGLLVVTTRSFGFPYHSFQGDHWRFELDDMQWIFRDFQILSLVPDPECHGVFLKCRKPAEYREAGLSGRRLFSVVKGERAEPDDVGDEEIRAHGDRMLQLGEIGNAISRVLVTVDLADAGQRDFRNLWRSVARLSDRIERVTSGSPSRPAWARWRRGLEGLRREALELLTAARLARGRSFGRARQALLGSAWGRAGDDFLRVPWGAVGDEPFREILDAAGSVRTLCLKVQSYARPAARD
jgi:SAM-dependent methyltransferase